MKAILIYYTIQMEQSKEYKIDIQDLYSSILALQMIMVDKGICTEDELQETILLANTAIDEAIGNAPKNDEAL